MKLKKCFLLIVINIVVIVNGFSQHYSNSSNPERFLGFTAWYEISINKYKTFKCLGNYYYYDIYIYIRNDNHGSGYVAGTVQFTINGSHYASQETIENICPEADYPYSLPRYSEWCSFSTGNDCYPVLKERGSDNLYTFWPGGTTKSKHFTGYWSWNERNYTPDISIALKWKTKEEFLKNR